MPEETTTDTCTSRRAKPTGSTGHSGSHPYRDAENRVARSSGTKAPLNRRIDRKLIYHVPTKIEVLRSCTVEESHEGDLSTVSGNRQSNDTYGAGERTLVDHSYDLETLTSARNC